MSVTLQQRIQQLKKSHANLPAILRDVAKNATLKAIEATQDATPPKKGIGQLAGTNLLSGELKQHWATDSKPNPQVSSGKYTTSLANNLSYASFVNDGHRMDRHFVPGLYIDENGQLNRNVDGKGGLIVGTKTKYVKGEFMVDKGKEAYQKTVESELDKKIRENYR